MRRISLNGHSLELDGLQQLAQGLNLTTGIGGAGALGDRHAQRLGIETHLGNETSYTVFVLSDGAPQCLSVTHQSVELLGHTRLGRHPFPQQAFKVRHIQLGQQQPERRGRWRLTEVSAQQLAERL